MSRTRGGEPVSWRIGMMQVVTLSLVVMVMVTMAVTEVEGAASVNNNRRRNEHGGGGGGLKGRRRCASLDDNLIVPAGEESFGAHGHDGGDDGGGGDIEELLLTEMVCAKDSQFCYALWSDFANGTRKWIKQGCWEASSTVPTCENSQCVARVPKDKQQLQVQQNQGEGQTQGQGGQTLGKEGDGGGGIQQETTTQGGGAGGGGGGGEPLFCCCDRDNCNSEVEINYVDPEEDSSSEEDDILGEGMGGGGNKKIAIGLVVTSASVICGVMMMVAGYKYWKRLSKRRRQGKDGGGGGGGGNGEGGGDDDGDGEGGFGGEGKGLLLGVRGEGDSLLGEDSGLNDPIQLVVLLAGGKFASVYEGRIPSLRDGPFALKCFAREQKEFFENERFIFEKYLGKHCNHENIVKYHGWQDFTVGPTTHLILVLDKICPGSLRDYLQSITMSVGDTTAENENEGESVFKVQDVLKICSGIASGLSYLHGENRDEIVIAHRDLTSKNILLDGSTLTAKITDFGLSLVTSGSKYYWAGRERQAEFCSLAEAGTLRYMAPELLEGAVNLKDCENALKQADVYALALVLWEVANCSPEMRLTQQVVTPQQNGPQSQEGPQQPPQPVVIQHSLPYEDEIGKENLNMDSLSRHVVQYRQRPHFRKWRDSPYTRQLRDTLIESWDAEPDARLTALCIVERLVDIKNIRIKNTDHLSSNKVCQGQGSNMLQNSGGGGVVVGGGMGMKALQSPLESPTSGLFGADGTGPVIIDSPWTGRNPCLQRNLLVNATTSSSSSGGTEGMSTSGSILSDGTSTGGGGLIGGGGHLGHGHPLLLNHFDLAKNHANLNFYHNYVGGSSGGSSYTGSTTNGGGGGGGGGNGSGGGNVTEVSNVSSVTDERHNLAMAATRCPSAAVAPYSGGQQTNTHPLPPSIPFVQNLHN